MSLNISQKKLLDNLISDEKKFNKKLYSAGPYWDYKAKKIIYWLKKRGLENFRGLNSGVATSYADNVVLDIRNELGFKGRLLSKFTNLPFIKNIFREQVKITSDRIKNFIDLQQVYYENNNKIKHLIANYKFSNSVNFGCQSKIKINNDEFSTLYLDISERIENINKILNLKEIKSYMEIGGGFGANIHLLLENFKNIKKIFYIDIVPNLFVGTEYLRGLFGKSVKDYSTTRNQSEISFEKNNILEIICIPPWEMKKISSKVESFHNAASFQEMSFEQVENYKNLIKKLLNKNSISLIVYKGWEKNNTLGPDEINKIFDNQLIKREFAVLDNPTKEKLIYLTSI